MNVSIIVPAYNEEDRIGKFLPRLLEFSKDHEVIIVNDGSKDKTLEIVKGLIKNYKNARVISYPVNQGKGYAVQKGVLDAKGKKILFIDADGSIQPDQIPLMLEKLDKYDVVVGDRASKHSKIKVSKLRKLTGVLFNFYTDIIFFSGNQDNLCGFKGFKRDVARDLFSNLTDNRWIFDVELFYKIRKKRYELYKLPLVWEHVDDSKISAIDPFKMLFQLVKLRVKLLKNEKKK